ncbi:uncharacterized protein YdaU (DUF1376 family) [Parvibaculum indicum]|uniref:DUF1376 domain-containing protein n=1 Tax=Parvibaculum indicum TaxID=562969 RepID=UPI00141F5A68|nr:uncharacterized protein YdaU (DUF1376 family) [Parvibaculum indicum]
MNFYERHLGDYAKDTAHLSMLEHGAYSILLDRYYGTEEGIPEASAHRLARARTEEEKAAVDAVLDEFFTLVDGVWINNRAEEEISKTKARIEAAKVNGARGGRPKKRQDAKEKETREEPTGFNNETQKKPRGFENETQQEPKGFENETQQEPRGSENETQRKPSPSKTETQTKAHQTPVPIHQNITAAADARARDGTRITPEMEEQLFEAAGNALNVPAGPDLLSMARPLTWLESGADWELDVLPAVRAHAARGRPHTIRSWFYFDSIIADAKAKRLKPMPEGRTDDRSSNRQTGGTGRRRATYVGIASSGD